MEPFQLLRKRLSLFNSILNHINTYKQYFRRSKLNYYINPHHISIVSLIVFYIVLNKGRRTVETGDISKMRVALTGRFSLNALDPRNYGESALRGSIN